MHSALISSLYNMRSTTGLFPQEPDQTNAASGNGKSSAKNTISTHFSIKYRTRSRFSKFLPARVGSGLLAHNGEPVHSRTAEAYLRAVGQTFPNVGIEDPRFNKHGIIDHRLQRQLRGWTKLDGPLKRLKPINIGLIHHTFAALHRLDNNKSNCRKWLIYVAGSGKTRPRR